MYPFDITLPRLHEALAKFGASPRVCFAAARGYSFSMPTLAALTTNARSINDIAEMLLATALGEKDLDTVFEVFPKNENRL